MSRSSRVRVGLGIALLLAAGCSASTRGTARTQMTAKEIVARYKPAIVRIEARLSLPGADRTGGKFGTGFLIGSDGLIATNLHVIVGTGDILVRLANGSEFKARRVVAVDPRRDLAIIDIDAVNLPIARLGNSDEVAAGDRVVAIGNPLGVLDYTVSDGLISSVRQIEEGIKVLQISAPISQGSSGGPLFNPYGEVIGVATLISDEGQNLNFGVPSNYLLPLMATKDGGESVEAFAARFRPSPRSERPGRQVPHHPLSVLDGCSAAQIADVYGGITDAINIGAPVYNRGEHEACFVIYRKVAEKFEAETKMCKGVREAFGQGLLRAETIEDFTGKAWAMRDTFDGLLDVMERKGSAGRP